MLSSDALIPKYSDLVYNGFWLSPERGALQALVTETQRDVTGVVRLKLYKGNVIVAGRKSRRAFTTRRSLPWNATRLHMIKAMHRLYSIKCAAIEAARGARSVWVAHASRVLASASRDRELPLNSIPGRGGKSEGKSASIFISSTGQRKM